MPHGHFSDDHQGHLLRQTLEDLLQKARFPRSVSAQRFRAATTTLRSRHLSHDLTEYKRCMLSPLTSKPDAIFRRGVRTLSRDRALPRRGEGESSEVRLKNSHLANHRIRHMADVLAAVA
jgi:hypothetical protein